MNGLPSARQHERITSGLGSLAVTDYRLLAPNRMAYRTKVGGEAVIVGGREGSRTVSSSEWRSSRFAGGGPPFKTNTWFAWTPYAESVRLLGVSGPRGHRIAEVALYEPGAPDWWRLRIDLASRRVPSAT